MEANDYVGKLKLSLNQESSVDAFGTFDQSAHKTSTAPFTNGESRRTQHVKRKLEEFVLVSNMYDSKVDYRTFAKSLLKKKEKSNFGLVDPYDSLVGKAVRFKKEGGKSSKARLSQSKIKISTCKMNTEKASTVALLKHSCKAAQKGTFMTLNNNDSGVSFNEFNENSFHAKKNSMAATGKAFKRRKVSVPVCAQSNFLRTAPLFQENKWGASEVYANGSNEGSRERSPLTPGKFMQMKKRVQHLKDDRSSSFNIYRDNFTKNKKMNMRLM
jgi:hypothetical protein